MDVVSNTSNEVYRLRKDYIKKSRFKCLAFYIVPIVIVMIITGVKAVEFKSPGFIVAFVTILLFLLPRFLLISRFYKMYSIRIDETGIFQFDAKNARSIFYPDMGRVLQTKKHLVIIGDLPNRLLLFLMV